MERWCWLKCHRESQGVKLMSAWRGTGSPPPEWGSLEKIQSLTLAWRSSDLGAPRSRVWLRDPPLPPPGPLPATFPNGFVMTCISPSRLAQCKVSVRPPKVSKGQSFLESECRSHESKPTILFPLISQSFWRSFCVWILKLFVIF